MLINRKLITFFSVILILSFMHSILRINDTSSLSLYRLLMPFSLLIFIFTFRKSLNIFIFYFLFFFYNLILTVIYTSNYSHFVITSIHYLSILNIYIIIYYLYISVGFRYIYNLLYYFFFISIILAILELLFNFQLPNTAIYYDSSVSAFNWNQNELGTILLSFIPFILVYKRKYIKVLFLSIVIYINFINDAKVVLISIILAIFIYILKTSFLEVNKYLKLLFFISLIFICIILINLPYETINLQFRDYEISIYDLLILPLSHISELSPFIDHGGSITTRANTIIFGLIELKNSFFLGIGTGNSLVMLEKPQYLLMSAKSMHNLPIQLIVENGIIMLVIFIYLLIIFFKLLYKQNLKKEQLLILVAIPTILLGSMGSSIGILSDYFFFASISLMIIHYKYSKKGKKCIIT